MQRNLFQLCSSLVPLKTNYMWRYSDTYRYEQMRALDNYRLAHINVINLHGTFVTVYQTIHKVIIP